MKKIRHVSSRNLQRPIHPLRLMLKPVEVNEMLFGAFREK